MQNLSSRSSGNITAAFAYVTFIPAIVFLSLERFRHDRFIRFHSFQSIFLTVGTLVLGGLLRILFAYLIPIPFMIAILIAVIIFLGCFFLWLVLVVKALQGAAI